MPGADIGAVPPPSETVAWKLVQTLYDQTLTLVFGGVALASAAIAAGLETHQAWYFEWAVAVGILLVVRLGLVMLFHHRRRTRDAKRWLIYFTVGAWLMGALSGMSALTIVFDTDWPTRMLIITTQGVLMMGAAARNAGSPLAATGQIALGLGPVLIVCLANSGTGYVTFGCFIAFALGAALALLFHLHQLLLRLLTTDAQNSRLLGDVRRANLELATVNRQLEGMATTDALTGIANRRRFDEVLRAELRRAQRDGTSLSLVLLDVDSFKSFNDLYGHLGGDECLRRIAQTTAQALRRPADLLARYGGEEFGLILPQTEAAAAALLAMSIRAKVEALAMVHAATPSGVVTVSIGVATCALFGNCGVVDLIGSADQALYAAKAAGRNTVRVAPRTSGDAALTPSPTPA